MTARKKHPNDLFGMPLGEALERFAHTDPKELRDAMEKLKEQREGVDTYVKERTEAVRKGARTTGKRFRL
jgi:hypothetical protein